MARSRSRLALTEAGVVSRLSRCRAGAAITGVGTLPMRTVSRQAYDSQCPSVNPNVFNGGHTVPVDERLPLAETFCGIVYRANCISLYVRHSKHALDPCAPFSAL